MQKNLTFSKRIARFEVPSILVNFAPLLSINLPISVVPCANFVCHPHRDGWQSSEIVLNSYAFTNCVNVFFVICMTSGISILGSRPQLKETRLLSAYWVLTELLLKFEIQTYFSLQTLQRLPGRFTFEMCLVVFWISWRSVAISCPSSISVVEILNFSFKVIHKKNICTFESN